jgi:hypothetical protein
MNLTMAVVAINGWNRIAIAFRSVPGTYQPPVRRHAEPAPEPAAEPVGATVSPSGA